MKTPGNTTVQPPLLTRRDFLQSVSAGVAGAALVSALPGPVWAAASASSKPGFVHRSYNGWITDLATEPDPHARWPSMRLDERLLADFHETFGRMESLGFNEIVIWGLYVANAWPLDIQSAVHPERRKLLARLIADAHAHGLKVVSGLGVYSWGFTEIIKAHPSLRGGNPNAMCGSEPQSDKWMQRILDFMFSRLDIDGVSMQSGDQGRCRCDRCATLPDAEYHARLNIRTAEYIRSRWPNKVIGMSNWGIPFGKPEDKEALVRMSHALDYMIDYNDSVRHAGQEYRRDFIGSLGCSFGTNGGPVVEPPQHWNRDRWFLPTCRRVHRHLQTLAKEGGGACELFYHILANPSSELTFHVAGRTLSDPAVALEQAMAEAVTSLYQPASAQQRDDLARFFLDAEDAYMRYLDPEECGTISMEPLVSDAAGPAVYLRDRLNGSQRKAYNLELDRLAATFAALRSGLRSSGRVERIPACLRNVQIDLAGALK